MKVSLLRKRELLTAGFVLAAGVSGASSSHSSENDTALKNEKLSHITNNPSDNLIQKTTSELSSLTTDGAIRLLEERGAFFVDYENFTKTGDISSSIVYFTQEQMAEKGLKSIGTSPYDVSLARENHAILTGDKEKDAAVKKKAFSNIKGTFNGGYQFNKSNMENIVLWGLIQEDNPEIKNFCKKFARPGVDIEKDQRLAKYRSQWQKHMDKVQQGKYSETYALNVLCRIDNSDRAAALSCLDVSKVNFNKISQANPKGSEKAQQGFCNNVYMKMSKHYKAFCNANFIEASAAFSAYIHLPNGSATPAILKDQNLSSQQKAQNIINRESGKDSYGRELMQQAQENIYNKGYPELSCFKEWASLTGRNEIINNIDKGVELVAAAHLEKIPVDKNLYASVIKTSEGVPMAVFQTQNQKSL